jgi:hypothetical protein
MRRPYLLDGINSLDGEPRSDIGPVAQYLADIYELRPEVVRIEQLEFRVIIESRVVTFESGAKRIDPEFAFALRRIKGYGSAPAATAQFVENTTFNITDQGRARGGIFQDPVRMSVLCAVDGSPTHDMVWDSFYTFVAGADISAEFNVGDLTAYPAAGKVEFGISVTGDVIRTRRLPGGAMVVSDQNGNRRG